MGRAMNHDGTTMTALLALALFVSTVRDALPETVQVPFIIDHTDGHRFNAEVTLTPESEPLVLAEVRRS